MRFQILKAVTIRFNPCETKSSRWKKKEKKTFYFRIRRKNFFSNTRPISAKYFLYIESRGWWKSRKAKVVSKFRPMNQHHLLSTPLSACPSINHPRWARYSAHFLVDRSGNTSLSVSRQRERERFDTLVSRAQVSHRCRARLVSLLDCLSPRLYHLFFSVAASRRLSSPFAR